MAVSRSNGPEYPYGFCLEFESDTIKKLGLDKYEVGDDVHIVAVGTITRYSMAEHDNGEQHKNMSLQIEKMEIGNKKELATKIRESAAKKVYDTE